MPLRSEGWSFSRSRPWRPPLDFSRLSSQISSVEPGCRRGRRGADVASRRRAARACGSNHDAAAQVASVIWGRPMPEGAGARPAFGRLRPPDLRSRVRDPSYSPGWGPLSCSSDADLQGVIASGVGRRDTRPGDGRGHRAHATDPASSGAENLHPRWSPDGDHARTEYGTIATPSRRTRIHLVNARRYEKRIVVDQLQAGEPEWSLMARRICSHPVPSGEGGLPMDPRLGVMGAHGSKATQSDLACRSRPAWIRRRGARYGSDGYAAAHRGPG